MTPERNGSSSATRSANGSSLLVRTISDNGRGGCHEEGQVEAQKHKDDGTIKHLRVMNVGDLCGEVGPLAGGQRTADVVALEDSQLLVLSWGRIDRLTRRFPILAFRLFRNLTRIIGAHEGLTDQKGMDAVPAHPRNVIAGMNAAFCNQDPFVGNSVQQFERGVQADLEAAQVPVVDADHAAVGERALELVDARRLIAGIHEHGVALRASQVARDRQPGRSQPENEIPALPGPLRGGFFLRGTHRILRLARPINTRMTVIIQKRTMTFGSAQPLSS